MPSMRIVMVTLISRNYAVVSVQLVVDPAWRELDVNRECIFDLIFFNFPISLLAVCFKIFDVDSDGVLSHSETLQMINVLLYVAKENRNVDMYKDITKQEALRDIVNFTNQKGGGTAGVNDNKMMVRKMKKLDYLINIEFISSSLKDSKQLADMTITLTAEDFMMWNVESSLKLLQPFLDLIFEVCHIVFGLWPQCRHMEHDIGRIHYCLF